MDMNKFLQRDINEFLDRKAEEQHDALGKMRGEEYTVFTVGRDYSKEFSVAIEQNNNRKAENIIEELYAAKNSAGEDDENKEKITAIFEEIMKQVEEDTQGEQQKELHEFIEKVKSGETKGITTPGSELTPYEQEELEKKKKVEKLDSELEELVGKIDEAIMQNDITTAASLYKEIQEKFHSYPDEEKDKKVGWYNQVILLYEQIKRLEERIKRNKTADLEKEKVQEKQKEEEQEEQRKAQLIDIKNRIKKIIFTLEEEKDVHKVENELIDVRRAIAALDEKSSKEKQGFENIVGTITIRIQHLKQQDTIQDAKERRKKAEEQLAHSELSETHREEELKQQEQIRQAILNVLLEREKKEQEEQLKQQEAEKIRQQQLLAQQEKVPEQPKMSTEQMYFTARKYQEEGKMDEAEELYRQMIQLSPQNIHARIRLEEITQQKAKKKGL